MSMPSNAHAGPRPAWYDAPPSREEARFVRDFAREGAGEPGSLGADFHAPIRDIVLNPKIPGFDKRRQVAELIRTRMEAAGFFCRAADSRLFYFREPERRLYDLDTRDFYHLLAHLSGLGATETFFKFTLDRLQTIASRTSPRAIHTLAHFDDKRGVLAVSNGSTGVWVRVSGGAWAMQPNGRDGFLFFNEPDAEVWEPDLAALPGSMRWFLNTFLFAERDGLSRSDQQTLFLVNLLHQFFPCRRRTRMVPAFLGPQGSGKTTAMKLLGALICGANFAVTGLHRDREDAFVAAACNRVVLGLDNADSRIPWLEDALATYATGLRYRLRRLYTTNDEVSYEPRAMLMISSRDPRFRRPDVAERLIPFHFERPTRYVAESTLAEELRTRRSAIWGELLLRLGEVADAMGMVNPPTIPFRMADFGAFGWIVSHVQGKDEEWTKLLSKLERSQMGFAAEGDGALEALRTVVNQNHRRMEPTSSADLFKQCAQVAEAENLPFPRSAQGFGRWLTNASRMIEVELGVRITYCKRHGGQRWIAINPTNGDAGGDGDDDFGKASNSEESL